MPTNPISARASGDTSICVGCGICCDGTFLAKVTIDPGEEERLSEAGLAIKGEEEKRWFALPCSAFGDGRCTIYARRPGICRAFRCKLLKSYQAGEISHEGARQKIDLAIELRRQVAEEEPAAARQKERRLLRAHLDETRERPQLLLKITALEYCLDRWFRKNKGTEDADGPDKV